MSNLIVSPKNFNCANIVITPLKSLDSGAKQAYVNYAYDANTRKNLSVQVSTLPVPYGMNMFDKAGPPKYSVDLSLRGYDDNPKVKQIYEMFTALDEYMVDQGVANSKTWFKAQLTRDVVKAFYTPLVRWSKDAEGNVKPYPPTLKVQLKQRDGKFDVTLFDENKNELKGVPLDELLVKGSQVTSVIQCTSLWFAGSKFGLSWKAVQIRMDKMPDSIRGYAFQDDDDAPSVKPKFQQQQQKAAPVTAASPNKFSSLDAEEEDEGEDDAAFSAPAPAQKQQQQQQQSVLSAMMPQEEEGEAEDVEPVKVPVKTTVTAKKIIKKVGGK
jgi:Family of unknown function (DUF5871)